MQSQQKMLLSSLSDMHWRDKMPLSVLNTDSSGANMARRRKTRIALDPVTIEFGKRLSKAVADKGWTQAEFAREATKRFPGKGFRRDNISLYMRGIQLPGPARMAAICRTLGVDEQDLVVEGSAANPETPPFAMRPLEGGMVWLQVNQSVPYELAMDIGAMLRGRK